MKKGLLLLAVAAVYARVLHAPFVYDDKKEVVGNLTIRVLSDWQAIATYNYARPLLILSYALNWRLGGLDPLGYHLVSLGIHLVNTLLALALAKRILSPERALLATALWALHPLCTEAVTYTTGRSDAFVATWILLATAMWIDHVRGNRTVWPAVGAFALGLATKEIAAATPLVWLAAELWLVRGGERRLVEWRRYAPFAAVLGAAVIARVGLYGWPQAEVARTLPVHVLGQAEVWVYYLGLWIVPWGQSILHDYVVTARILGVVAVAVLTGLTGLAVRRRGIPAFGAVLWVTPLLISSAFVLKETMAEHRTYLAGYGLILGLVALLPYRRGLWAVPAVLAALTLHRNEDWRTEVSLWASATSVNAESSEAWYGYGQALRLARRFSEAEAAYRESLRLAPDRPDTLVDLGITRAQQGDEADATRLWKEALRLKPGHCPALNNLANLAARQGDRSAAIASYVGTLRFCPEDALANLSLGDLYWEAGDLARAAVHYRAFLATRPGGESASRARERLQPILDAGLLPQRAE